MKPVSDSAEVKRMLEGVPASARSPLRQALAFGKDQFAFFDEQWRELGDVYQWQIPNDLPRVVLGHPEDIKKIFTLRPESLYSPDLAFHGNLGDRCLLFADGERHKKDRSLLHPALHGTLLESYGPHMLECMESALDGWTPGEVLKVQDELTDVTLRVIVRCVLGASDEARERLLMEVVLDWVESIYRPGLFLFSMLRGLLETRRMLERKTDERLEGRHGWLPYPGRKSTKLKARYMRTVEEDILRCRREGAEGRQDVLARVASAAYEDGEQMDVRGVIDQLTLLFSAGHETTAKSLGWVLKDILERPELLVRIRAEIDEHFGEGPLDPSACRKLPLMNSVIKESMRLTPVTTILSREITRPVELRDHTLPVGVVAAPCHYIAHRHPDYWERPDEFIPERFIDYKPPPYVYFPFGGGRRRCLGATFAEFEMPILLAPILRRVDLSLVPGVKIEPVFAGVTLGPSDGLPLRVDAIRPRRASRS